MASKYSYNFTLTASYEMIEAEKYIAEILCNVDASKDLAINIKKAVEAVCKNPMLNNDCDYYGVEDRRNRYIKVKNYNLFYYVDEEKNEITFLRFLYNKMNVKNNDIKM